MMHGKQNVKFYSRGIGNERYVVINTNNLRESAYWQQTFAWKSTKKLCHIR